MARRVGNDEFPFLRGEEPVGHINGNTLFPLGGKAINRQRQVHVLALSAVSLGIVFEAGKLVFGNLLGIQQQASDQGAFAVVHAAAGEKTQQALIALFGKIGLNLGLGVLRRRSSGIFGNPGIRHQKYPSCFLRSMEASATWSMTRPCRSDVVDSSIS